MTAMKMEAAHRQQFEFDLDEMVVPAHLEKYFFDHGKLRGLRCQASKQASKQESKQASEQASKQAGKQASRQAGKQAGRQAGRQARHPQASSPS